MDLTWHSRAACRGMAPRDGTKEPHLFYPGKGEPTAHIKKICEGCPVRSECLESSVAAGEGEHWGIWGATTGTERRRIRRDMERKRRLNLRVV